jgi:DNA repair protein RadC
MEFLRHKLQTNFKLLNMKTQKQQLKEKATAYGFQAMTDAELIALTGYRGENFMNSQNFKAFKELQRRQEAETVKKIQSSGDAYRLLSFLEGLDHEQFWVIYLKRNNAIIKTEFLSKGGTTGTVADIKLIIKESLNAGAQGLILAHNHPSGELRPSNADMELTNRIKQAAKLFEIAILDHVIIGDGKRSEKYWSFADEGTI